MPLFYFNVYNDEITIDEEGRELPDLEAARDVAIESGRELICARIREGQVDWSHRIEVADSEGGRLLVLRFGECFSVAG